MNNFEAAVGVQTKVYFTSIPGRTITGGIVLVNGAIIGSPVLTVYEVTNGLFVADYLPTITGSHCLFIDNQLVARIEVVQKTVQTLLKNIEDESLGSWVWDKQAGTLQMFRQDGTELARFNVEETLETSSRERT
jgi:hypothetical protein